MSVAEEDFDALKYARQVLKEVSEWQKYLTSDLEYKQRSNRTAELYSIVDAIGQNEEKVELARIRQLVREHITATEADVKEKVDERLKLMANSVAPALHVAKKTTKFASRLPRVALLPPKGRQVHVNDKTSNATEKREDVTNKSILRKRPLSRARPKTLSELMERHTKPLPGKILEEFSLSNIGLPMNSASEAKERKNLEFAVPLAPPVRIRPNEVSSENVAPTFQRSNVAVFTIDPKETDLRKLTVQTLPSVHIESRTRLQPSQGNVKLISIVNQEDGPEKMEENLSNEAPGAFLGNAKILEENTALDRVAHHDELKNKLAVFSSKSVNAEKTGKLDPPLHFTRENVGIASSLNLRHFNGQPTKVAMDNSSNNNARIGYSKSLTVDSQEPVTFQRPLSGNESLQHNSTVSNHRLKNLTNVWAEQELIGRIVQEVTRNTAMLRPYFVAEEASILPDEDLIQQLVLEVVQENLKNGSYFPLPASGSKTKACDNSQLEEVNNIQEYSNDGKDGTNHGIATVKDREIRAEFIGKSITDVPVDEGKSFLDENTGDHQSKTPDHKSETDSVRTSEQKPNGDKQYRDAEVNTVANEQARGTLPTDIALHVVIEDKRGLEKKADDLNLRGIDERPSTVIAEPVPSLTELATKPKLQEIVKCPVETIDVATESDLSHLEIPLKVVRNVGVNVTLEDNREFISVGTQMEMQTSDFLGLLSLQSVDSSQPSLAKSPVSSSEDDDIRQQKSVRDAAVQLSSHSSSSNTANTTLTTTTSSDEPISEGELLFRSFREARKQPNRSLESTLQSIDEGEVARAFSDGEIPVALHHSLQRVLSLGEVNQNEHYTVSPPLTEPKTKAGRRDDRSRLKLTASSSEGEMRLNAHSTTSSEESSSSGSSPDILASPDVQM